MGCLWNIIACNKWLIIPPNNGFAPYWQVQMSNNKNNKGCVTLWPCHLHFLKKYCKVNEEL